jgi:ABC-type transporter lipoprotein component MlaA
MLIRSSLILVMLRLPPYKMIRSLWQKEEEEDEGEQEEEEEEEKQQQKQQQQH